MSGFAHQVPRPEYPQLHARQRYTVTGEYQDTVDLVSYLLLMPEWRFHPRRHCRGMDPNDFFGSDDAAAVCKGCPVEKECKDWAVQNGEFGVWGGTSERKRRGLRRQAKRAS